MKVFYKVFLYSILFFGTMGCQKLVDVGDPHGKIVSGIVFSSDQTAEASVRGMYSINQISPQSATANIANGGITLLGGLSSDEMSYGGTTTTYQQFAANNLTSEVGVIDYYMWGWGFKLIYHANACVEGLQQTEALTPSLRKQLLGESLFVRAFWYFNLTQLFGDVPWITQTDHRVNGLLPRTAVSEIYTHLIDDLKDAVDLMGDVHPIERYQRPSKWTAHALLARLYLYQENWEQAAIHADEVIKAGRYQLLTDLGQVFLNQSPESLWQIPTVTSYSPNGYTSEGMNYMRGTTLSYYLSPNQYNAFEVGDSRRIKWIEMRTVGGGNYPHPSKYKNVNTSPASAKAEGYVMMRYAEMFLIRAEANVHLNKLQEAMDDLDRLRLRADLALYGIQVLPSQEEALARVEQERRSELFAEWGHRWFDLRRMTGRNKPNVKRVDEVMPAIKPQWKSTSVLFPIPYGQLQLNSKLVQNDGY